MKLVEVLNAATVDCGCIGASACPHVFVDKLTIVTCSGKYAAKLVSAVATSGCSEPNAFSRMANARVCWSSASVSRPCAALNERV